MSAAIGDCFVLAAHDASWLIVDCELGKWAGEPNGSISNQSNRQLFFGMRGWDFEIEDGLAAQSQFQV